MAGAFAASKGYAFTADDMAAYAKAQARDLKPTDSKFEGAKAGFVSATISNILFAAVFVGAIAIEAMHDYPDLEKSRRSGAHLGPS